jgi:pimeloyl-ACP methyl ester carboxylesterase
MQNIRAGWPAVGLTITFTCYEWQGKFRKRFFSVAIPRNEQRKTRPLTLPVLAIGGAESLGEGPADSMKLAADDVQAMVIPGCGHWVAEEAPEQTLAALTAFLAPYRAAAASTS